MAAISDFPLRLDAFEGPLDLLLYLIRKNEVDLYDIPIADITKQYSDMLHAMKELNMDLASEYVVMAATLIYIKSRMLLPHEKDGENDSEEDPRRELSEQLAEYQKYKDVGLELRNREERSLRLWQRPDAVLRRYGAAAVESQIAEVWDLVSSYRALLERRRQSAMRVEGEDFRIEDKMKVLLELLVRKGTMRLGALFQKAASRLEKVVIFTALLELMRLKKLSAFQKESFADIHLTLYEKSEVLKDSPYSYQDKKT